MNKSYNEITETSVFIDCYSTNVGFCEVWEDDDFTYTCLWLSEVPNKLPSTMYKKGKQ